MHNSESNQIFCKFVGTWKLIECIQTDAQGNVSYPWGNDAIGYLIYTSEGIMAVQIMRKNRISSVKKDALQTSTQDGQEFVKDYNAYFGPFEIDEANKTVIHTVEGHLNPNMVGKKNIRVYDFYDDKLSLTTQGDPVLKKLLWEKI